MQQAVSLVYGRKTESNSNPLDRYSVHQPREQPGTKRFVALVPPPGELSRKSCLALWMLEAFAGDDGGRSPRDQLKTEQGE